MNNNSALGAIRRRWWIIVLLAAIGAALAAVPETERVQEQVVRSFSATHTMLVNDTESIGGVSGVSPNQVPLLATTGEVPTAVVERLGYSGNAAELASQVAVAFDFTTGALTFDTTQDTAAEAESIADAFAEETAAYLAARQDEVYTERVGAALGRLETLEEDLDELTAQLAVDPEDPALQAQRDAISRQYSVAFEQSQALSIAPPGVGFTTLQRAQAVETTSDTGISTPTSRRTRSIMGAVAGIAIGSVIAILLGRLDRKIRTKEQAEELFGLRARASIPKVDDDAGGGLVVITGRHDTLADSYRTLRNVVNFVQAGLGVLNRAPITLVVSPGPGDGKTSAAANLAAAFVENGDRTIAINTDFRRPRLGAALRSEGHPTLPFEFDELGEVPLKPLLSETDLAGLLLFDLSSVEATSGELVRYAARRVPDIAARADQVVIDSSPVGATAEVLEMIPLADTIVVVARLGHTSIEAATSTMSVLRDLTTAPIVLALTGTKLTRTQYYEYTDRQRDQVASDDAGRKRFRWSKDPGG